MKALLLYLIFVGRFESGDLSGWHRVEGATCMSVPDTLWKEVLPLCQLQHVCTGSPGCWCADGCFDDLSIGACWSKVEVCLDGH